MLQHEPTIRLGVFLGVLLTLLALERLMPWGHARPLGLRRWPGNIGLALPARCWCGRWCRPRRSARRPGPRRAGSAWSRRSASRAGWRSRSRVLLLDLLIYWQHRVTHAVPLLWRLHRVHHADPELDATSALRFHPVEILLSMGLKMAAVVALGAPPVGVLAFEVLLNATAMFNHAAIRLPKRLEAALRLVLVTPDMHRTHHSEVRAETDSCYGFCLPWWDRIFGSYRAAPAAGEGVVIGVEGWRAPAEQRLDRLLLQPLLGAPGQFRLHHRLGAGSAA